MTRAMTGTAIVALTIAGFVLFPGHTYLHQDTQIYTPILEHLWNGSVLQNDILVQRPHVSFTLYDEIAVVLRKLTGAGFESILIGQQLLFRALGLWGIYLIVVAAGLARAPALLATAIWSLGATIVGPAVLLIEYEPTPRGFAVPLLFLAVGLMARNHPVWASTAASAAFLLHPPSVYPFWLVFFAMMLVKRRPGLLISLVPLAGAAVVLFIAAKYQSGITEQQHFFERIGPDQEKLQRMRASYNWVSLWWRDYFAQHAVLFAATVLAWQRSQVQNPVLKWFIFGMSGIGLASVPASYLLLERMKWTLMPQLQPARALLFVAGFALLMAAIAGCAAAMRRNLGESFAWFALAYLVPTHPFLLTRPHAGQVLAVALLATGAAFTIWLWLIRPRLAVFAIAVIAIAAMVMIPSIGGMKNYPYLRTPEVAQLSTWARQSTPPDSVFAFPAFGHRLEPGIFRSQALRAVYVDWKGGGQVNYLRELGEQWWERWQQLMIHDFRESDTAGYRALGIDYFVLTPENRLHDQTPLFANSSFVVYPAR